MRDIEELHSNLLTYKILYLLKINDSLRVPTIAELINGSIHLLQDLQEHDLIAYKASNMYTNSNHMILTYKGYKLLEGMLLRLFKIDINDIMILNILLDFGSTLYDDLDNEFNFSGDIKTIGLYDITNKESTAQKINIFKNGFINYNCEYSYLTLPISPLNDKSNINFTISDSGLNVLNIYNDYINFTKEMNIKFGVN